MKLSTYIMAHHSRLSAAMRLTDALGATVHVDFYSAGPWATARECWLAPIGDATHRLVMQDDALPCHDFLRQAHAAVAARPGEIVSFYTGRRELLDAQQRGVPWVTFDTFCSGLALCLPAELCLPFVDWCDAHIDPECPKDDLRMLLWAISTQRQIHCTAPSLAQHNPTLSGIVDQASNREDQSLWFRGTDPAPIDWRMPGACHCAGDRASFLLSRKRLFSSAAGPRLSSG